MLDVKDSFRLILILTCLLSAIAICTCYLAPDEFHPRMHSTLQGLSGVEAITDYVLAYCCGATVEECHKEHDTNLEQWQRNDITLYQMSYKAIAII